MTIYQVNYAIKKIQIDVKLKTADIEGNNNWSKSEVKSKFDWLEKNKKKTLLKSFFL